MASTLHFLDAPKFVRFLFVAASFSLSSVSLFLGLLALFPPADVGVGLPDALSRNVVDRGVGAGVEPTDPGVEESPLFGRYEMDEREKTRFCSAGPVLRRWAAAPLVPFM